MMMKKFIPFVLIALLLCMNSHAQGKEITLASGNTAIDIVVDAKDHPTVLFWSEIFADDIQRVSDLRPAIKHGPEGSEYCIVLGSIEKSALIQELVRHRKIDVSQVKGKWEAALTEIVDHPFPGVKKALVIAGSDRRGTVYALTEISKKIGVSPWYYFADVVPEKKSEIVLIQDRYIQSSPSVQYRGIFINDEMWGIRPWASKTLAPAENKGLGPTAYAKIFELLIRLKANCFWPAMHQQTRPFNCYPGNNEVAERYGIVRSTGEQMLRSNIAGAEWDREYPGEDFNYVTNKAHVYKYWEDAVKKNTGECIYTLGKRGKDDEPGKEINVEVLNEIIRDQRQMIKDHVNKDATKVPQIMNAYRELLDLYNAGAKIPDDVIFIWSDDNFGNIRQLPDEKQRRRSGGSGIYYHFQWINGATSAYPWLYTSPLAFTWTEMKKAYDYNIRKFWMVNVGDIKPAEIAIEHFMSMAWDIDRFQQNEPRKYLEEWAAYTFGKEFAADIADVFMTHTGLGFARRPEHMYMYNGWKKTVKYDWFSTANENDEAQRRVDQYDALCRKAEAIYEALPVNRKDAFFEMVLYNVKGAALQNRKMIYGQKSEQYGKEKRASAARYAAMAQNAEEEIFKLIDHYNTGLVTAGAKWNHMASVPGPWGGQWQQWNMPPLSYYSGEDIPKLGITTEGEIQHRLPTLSYFNKDRRFIDLYNQGNGCLYWKAKDYPDWIRLSATEGKIWEEQRIWVDIDWDKAPKGEKVEASIFFDWSSSSDDEWIEYETLPADRQKGYREGYLSQIPAEDKITVALDIFHPEMETAARGFVESDGCISMEAEHFSRKKDTPFASWSIVEGLGRTGNSVAVLPATLPAMKDIKDILRRSPSLEYDIYTFSEGKAALTLNCIPSSPIDLNHKLRYACSIDGQEPVIVDVESQKDEIANLRQFVSEIQLPAAGQHTLKIWYVDPALIIDKILLSTGAVPASYLGPVESLYHR